jgi:hypothetical protein
MFVSWLSCSFFARNAEYGNIIIVLCLSARLYIPSWKPFSGCWSKWLLDIIFYLVYEAIGTVATPGLLCQPRAIVKMIVEKQMECRLAGETEVLGETLPQRHFRPSQNPTWPDPSLNPGRRGGKPATNRLSYGAALIGYIHQHLLVESNFGPYRANIGFLGTQT